MITLLFSFAMLSWIAFAVRCLFLRVSTVFFVKACVQLVVQRRDVDHSVSKFFDSDPLELCKAWFLGE